MSQPHCEYCGQEERYGHNAICVMNTVEELRAEIERLRAGMKEYACTATDHPCGCYEQFLSERAEIRRLTDAIRRIDGANDNPACFNPNVDAVIREFRALEPKP